MRLKQKVMVFLSKRMIACDEASFLVSCRSDQRLGFIKWWQLKMHLLSCHLCRKYARQIEELNRTMVVYREHCSHESCCQHLSPDAANRVGEVLEQGLNAK
jgi:hypothetical protein